MKTLILMRHSHAVSNNSAYSDHERPLSDEGQTLATTTAKVLTAWTINEIICSTATRTVETAAILGTTLDPQVTPQTCEQLYLSSPASYSTVAASMIDDKSECVTMIGHNPGIASLISTWADEFVPVSPATAAIFQISIDNWKELTLAPVATQLVGLISDGVRVR